MKRKTSQNYAVYALISSVSVLIALIISEVILRLFFPLPDPYKDLKIGPQYIVSKFPLNMKLNTEAEPGLPGIEGRHVFTTNNVGFRGGYLQIPKPEKEYRIFMVGGSTTECLYLDDKDSIDHVLQDELKALKIKKDIRVYNAGKSGDRTDDHISMIAHRIVHLEPDMIIILCGINDLLAFRKHYDYLHLAPNKEGQFFYFKMLVSKLQLYRRADYLLQKWFRRMDIFETIPLRSDYKVKASAERALPKLGSDPPLNLKAYAENLRTLIGICKAHKITLVLMTQQTTWASTVDPHVKEWQWRLFGYREDRMDRAINAVNDVMRRSAAEFGVPLFDLAQWAPKSLEFFYDDFHFNVRGAKLTGKQLADFITEKKLIP